MLFAKRNKQLSIICKSQGEKLLEQTLLLKSYEKKLKDVKDIITTNSYGNIELQIRKIRKILNS